MSSNDLINNLMNGIAFGMLTSRPMSGGCCMPMSSPLMSYPVGSFSVCGGYNPFRVSLFAPPVITPPVMPMNFGYSNFGSRWNFNLPQINFANYTPPAMNWTMPALNWSMPQMNFSTYTPPSYSLGVGDTFTRSSSLNASYSNQKLGGSSTKYDALIQKYSKEYGVDPNLVKAVMKQESQFDPKATSPAGAKGLMQLMPATASSLGVTNPYDAEQNIKAGVKYLKQCLDARGGNIQLAVASYNAGPNNAYVKAGKIPQNGETPKYVNKVMQYYNEYRTTA